MRQNRSILLLSYYFPPLGMGGVGRARALFQYLPKFGYDIYALTVKNILYSEYDYSLLDGLAAERVIRTGSLDPARILYMLGKRKVQGELLQRARGFPLFHFPDSKRFWNIFAYRKALKIIKNENICAIITTSPPPSIHLLGLKLKRESHIPWVADFRDLWYSLPIEQVYASSSARNYSLRLKDRIIREADEIVSVNSDIQKYLGRGEVIRNGAELSIRHGWNKSNLSQKTNVTLGILGTINNLCPVEPLLAAVEFLDEKYPALKNRVQILHVGRYDESMMKELREKYKFGERLILKGYLPRTEAISALTAADMLFFSVGKFSEYNILPGRIYDYLLSGKPIIGVVPSGSDAEKLLNEHPDGVLVTDSDISKIAEGIKKFVESPGGVSPAADDILFKYSTEALAQKYALLLDRLLK